MKPVAPVSTRSYNDIGGTFDESREGELQIWDYPSWDEPYIIAADVAMGVGQDYSVATVMNKDRHIVAMFRSDRVDPTLFGEALFYLGRYFNNALLCVESNSIGLATVERLRQMQYVNMYYQLKAADKNTYYSNEEGMKPGFRTTQSTKPAIIALLQEAVREQDLYVPCKQMISELKTYVSDENGKTNALPGSYDDTIMAAAMALEVLRTHADKLVKDNIPWKQRVGNYQPDETEWF